MTKYVMIEEGGFGNQTGPSGIGDGSNPTGGEYTETITGKVMQGMKDFLTPGGGGGAGMFSALEWIMDGAVWPRAAAYCVCRVPDGAEELRAGECRGCKGFVVFWCV
jgi:hypothetical protein